MRIFHSLTPTNLLLIHDAFLLRRLGSSQFGIGDQRWAHTSAGQSRYLTGTTSWRVEQPKTELMTRFGRKQRSKHLTNWPKSQQARSLGLGDSSHHNIRPRNTRMLSGSFIDRTDNWGQRSRSSNDQRRTQADNSTAIGINIEQRGRRRARYIIPSYSSLWKPNSLEKKQCG
jgi:hypothetical protein